MDELKKIIPILSENNASVLLYGEKGTGKSYIASLVHQKKGGSAENFFEINCKSFSEEKNEEVLNNFKSFIKTASYSMLFLNCVNKMTQEMQTKLLNFLIEYSGFTSKFKLITSTEENIEQKIKEGFFSENLFYKLNSVVINVQPLRQRKDEIPLLLDFYRRLYCKQTGFNFTGFSQGAVELLQNYFFAGNIDELKNLVQHAFIVGEPPLLKASDFGIAASSSDLVLEDKSLKTAMDSFKKEYVTKILEENGWNQTKTAKILGIQRTYVIRLINELHIQKK